MADRLTIYEVAQRSGVSTATVSRVIHNGTGFSSSTKNRVLQAAEELGWVPSGAARGLASRRTGIVGLLFPDFTGGGSAEEESPLFVDQVIRGAERAATAAGDAMLVAATGGTAGRERAYAIASKVDGLVVMARSLRGADIDALARSVPVTVLAAGLGRRRADSISVDNQGGIRAVVEHLIQVHGHRDIVFVAGPSRSPDSMDRFAGFQQAMDAAGLSCPAEPQAVGEFTQAGGERAVRALFETRKAPPDAIVCGNDEMAIGALAVLAEARVKVPGEVAVTGFDDITTAHYVRPQLTTVAQPMRELGAHAVRLVLDRVADPATARARIVLPTELLVRRSCGCRPRKQQRTNPSTGDAHDQH